MTNCDSISIMLLSEVVPTAFNKTYFILLARYHCFLESYFNNILVSIIVVTPQFLFYLHIFIGIIRYSHLRPTYQVECLWKGKQWNYNNFDWKACNNFSLFASQDWAYLFFNSSAMTVVWCNNATLWNGCSKVLVSLSVYDNLNGRPRTLIGSDWLSIMAIYKTSTQIHNSKICNSIA